MSGQETELKNSLKEQTKDMRVSIALVLVRLSDKFCDWAEWIAPELTEKRYGDK